jgi:hypothetical protein
MCSHGLSTHQATLDIWASEEVGGSAASRSKGRSPSTPHSGMSALEACEHPGEARSVLSSLPGISTATSAFPYRLVRSGVIMRRQPGVRSEAEGVLNPASATTPDGAVWLLPRLVGPGNESRIGLARVVVENGVPVGTEPTAIVLEPEAHWEMAADHAGVEDPRVTRVPSLDIWVMCYVAFGPVGLRLALAVSRDVHYWQRLGPVHFAYDPAAAVDLGVLDNKDGALFPEPVPGPDGRPSYALLHRPVWDSRPAFHRPRAYVPSWHGATRANRRECAPEACRRPSPLLRWGDAARPGRPGMADAAIGTAEVAGV